MNADAEEQIIVRERLRLLAIGFYVKGAVGAVVVSFFLIHFFMLLGFSFLPESAWNPPPKPATRVESFSVTPSPTPRPVNQAPPVIMFRFFAAVIGVIILIGWSLAC